MAVAGRKPKPTHLHVVDGTINATRHANRGVMADSVGPLGDKPRYLKGRASRLWDEITEIAWWLNAADAPALGVWCCLMAEFEKGPTKMIASRIGQLRGLSGDLALDPASRARRGADGKPQKPKETYFD